MTRSILVLHKVKSKLGILIFKQESKSILLFSDIFIDDSFSDIRALIMTYSINICLIPYDLNPEDFNLLEESNIKIYFSIPCSQKLKIINKLIEIYSNFGIKTSILAISNLIYFLISLEEFECLNTGIQKTFDDKNVKNKYKSDENKIIIGSIDDIEILYNNLKNCFFINSETAYSLSLLSNHLNPNNKISSKNKKGLFDFINYSATIFGSIKLKEWILLPLKCLKLIKERTDCVEFLLQTKINYKIYKILKQYKFTKKNIDYHFMDKKEFFYAIIKILSAFFSVFKVLSTKQKEKNVRSSLFFPNLDKKEIENLLKLYKFLNSKIEESGKFIFKENVCKELDELKSNYNEIENKMTEIAKKLSEEYDENINIVYIPQTGFLIESSKFIKGLDDVNSNDLGINSDNINLNSTNNDFDKDLNINYSSLFKDSQENNQSINELNDNINSNKNYIEHKFKDKNNFYFKNKDMKQLDKTLGDLETLIHLKELKICNKIYIETKKHLQNLKRTTEYIGKIDALNSLSLSAHNNSMIRAKFNHNNIISFKKARYIFSKHKEIKLDINISKNTIITGENCSGKSSILRLIGHNQLLAQIGSFIPAEHANLIVCTNILTKMVSTENKKYKRSSFASELLQVNEMIRVNGLFVNGLFLIDEFGKGCNVEEGVMVYERILRGLEMSFVVSVTNFQNMMIKNEIDKSQNNNPLNNILRDKISHDKNSDCFYKLIDLDIKYLKLVKDDSCNILINGIYKGICAETLMKKIGFDKEEILEWKKIIEEVEAHNTDKIDIDSLNSNNLKRNKNIEWAIEKINNQLN